MAIDQLSCLYSPNVVEGLFREVHGRALPESGACARCSATGSVLAAASFGPRSLIVWIVSSVSPVGFPAGNCIGGWMHTPTGKDTNR